MNQTSLDYIVKALDMKIKVVSRFIQRLQNVIDISEKELRTKKCAPIGSGFNTIAFQFDEKDSKFMIKDSLEKMEKSQAHLEGYKKAKEDILKAYSKF